MSKTTTLSVRREDMKEGVVYRDARGVGYMLTKCIICGEQRPVSLLHGKPLFDRCKPCAMNTVETKARISKAKKGYQYPTRRKPIKEKPPKKSRRLVSIDGLFDSVRVGDMQLGLLYRDKRGGLYVSAPCQLCGQPRAVRKRDSHWNTRCHRCAMGTPQARKHLAQSHTGHPTSTNPAIEETRREKIGESSRKRWDDDEYRQRTVAAIANGYRRRPTKPEVALDALLQSKFPNQWIYNGDYSHNVIIGGLVPDFVNINGRKQVIELFGAYFHRHTGRNSYIRLPHSRTEEGRVAKFKEFGFDCLIVWENEMADFTKVCDRIRTFNG